MLLITLFNPGHKPPHVIIPTFVFAGSKIDFFSWSGLFKRNRCQSPPVPAVIEIFKRYIIKNSFRVVYKLVNRTVYAADSFFRGETTLPFPREVTRKSSYFIFLRLF